MDLKVTGQGGQINLNINQTNKEVSKEDYNNISKDKDKYDKKDIDKAITKLNHFLSDDNTHAEYNVHDKFGDVMIKIVDNKTKEVVMEVPPKKILDMVAKLCELVGVVFDKKA